MTFVPQMPGWEGAGASSGPPLSQMRRKEMLFRWGRVPLPQMYRWDMLGEAVETPQLKKSQVA